MLIDELDGIIGKCTQVALNRFVGTMDIGIDRRVMDIYPEAFVRGCVLLNDGIIRKVEGIGISIGRS